MHEANCATLCGETWTVIAAAGTGIAIILATVLFHPSVRKAWRENPKLGGRRPFTFTASWASNFTVTGALLGAILTANTGGTSPAPLLSWHSYQLLSILFAALIVLAPFAYIGHVRSFLVGTGLTFTAVVGQTGTATLIVYALGRAAAGSSGPILVSDLLLLVLVGIGLGIVVYVWRGIPKTVEPLTKRRGRTEPQKEAPAGEVDTELEDLLQQHGEFALNLETYRERRRGQKPKLPDVPLPA
jgi:hypothetical protein